MDPNSNLAAQNRLLQQSTLDTVDKARRRELREALAGWLARGGFPPDWTRYPQAATEYRKWCRMRAKFSDLAR